VTNSHVKRRERERERGKAEVTRAIKSFYSNGFCLNESQTRASYTRHLHERARAENRLENIIFCGISFTWTINKIVFSHRPVSKHARASVHSRLACTFVGDRARTSDAFEWTRKEGLIAASVVL